MGRGRREGADVVEGGAASRRSLRKTGNSEEPSLAENIRRLHMQIERDRVHLQRLHEHAYGLVAQKNHRMRLQTAFAMWLSAITSGRPPVNPDKVARQLRLMTARRYGKVLREWRSGAEKFSILARKLRRHDEYCGERKQRRVMWAWRGVVGGRRRREMVVADARERRKWGMVALAFNGFFRNAGDAIIAAAVKKKRGKAAKPILELASGKHSSTPSDERVSVCYCHQCTFELIHFFFFPLPSGDPSALRGLHHIELREIGRGKEERRGPLPMPAKMEALSSGWTIDEAIMAEKKRLVLIRFGQVSSLCPLPCAQWGG